VTFDVVRVRQGDKIFSPREPLSTLFSTDQRIDIRIIPHEGQGRLAARKNEVLRTFASQGFRNNGELILENVPIQRIQRQSVASHTGSIRDSLTLMLDKSEEARLMAASKKGQIRLLVHQDERTVPQPEPEAVENVCEIAEQTPILSVSLPVEQPLLPDIPLALEQSLLIPMESAPIVPMEIVQQTAPAPVPVAFDTFDSALPPAPAPVAVPDFALLPITRENEIPQNLDRLDQQQSDSPVIVTSPELVGGEMMVPIRNDAMVSFGTSPLRTLSSEHHVDQNQNPMLTQFSSPTNSESGPNVLSHPYSETILVTPRVNHAIQFLTPRNVTSANEYLQEMTKQTESVVMPPVLPSVTLSPTITQEKVPGYSPFERRIYTVLPNEDLDENSKEELPTPRLLKSSDTGTQMK
jgi:hypothetical protein